MGIDIQLPAYVMSYDGILGITESVFFLQVIGFHLYLVKTQQEECQKRFVDFYVHFRL